MFDGVNAQVGFHVQVGFEHLGGVAGLLRDDGRDLRKGSVGVARRFGCRRGARNGRGLGRRGFRLDGGTRCARTGHVPRDLAQGVVVLELQRLVEGDAEHLAQFAEEFGLFDGVNAEVGFHVQVGFEHLGGVAGLLRDDGRHLLQGTVLVPGDRGGLGGDRLRRGRGFRRDRFSLGGALVDDAQGAFLDLQLGALQAADAAEPRIVAALVGEAFVLARHQLGERQGDLAAESGGEAKGVAHVVLAALGEVEVPKFWVGVAEVGDGRHLAALQHLEGDGVLDAGALRVAREALGVGDDDLVRVVAEGGAQGVDLGAGAAAAGGRVGLVADEHGLLGDGLGVDAVAGTGAGDEVLHVPGDVLHVEAAAVERRIGDLAAQEFGDGAHAAGLHFGALLDDEADGAHADDHAVAARVEREGRFLDTVLGRRGPAGEEPGADPFEHGVRGDVVGADHEHALAAAHTQPVLGDGDRLRRARAGSVDLGVGALGADELGQLGVAEAQDVEQELAVELVAAGAVVGQHVLEAVELAFEPGGHLVLGLRVLDGAQQVGVEPLQFVQGATGVLVSEVLADVPEQVVDAGERAGEHDARVAVHRFWQQPFLGEVGSGAGLGVGALERDARVPQRLEARRDGVLEGAVKGAGEVAFDAPVGHVEVAAAAGQLDDLGDVVDDLEAGVAVAALDEADDVLVGDLGALRFGQRVDGVVAAQDAVPVVLGEQRLAGAGGADADAADGDVAGEEVEAGGCDGRGAFLDRRRRGCRRGLGRRRRRGAQSGFQGREATQHVVEAGGCRRGRGRREGGLGVAEGRRVDAGVVQVRHLGPVAPGAEEREQFVDVLDLALLGVVGADRHGAVAQAVLEDVHGEAGECLLGADLDEGPDAFFVHALHDADPLDGAGDLDGEVVADRLRVLRVRLGADVRQHAHLG